MRTRLAALPAMVLLATLAPATVHAAGAPCTSATLDFLLAQHLDTDITLQASSAGCATPEYRFFVQPPGGSWTALSGWGSATSFVWHPGHGAATGVYGIGVWARDSGSTATYEAYYLGTVTVKTDACDAVELNAVYPLTMPWQLTANVHGCVNPYYKFWALPPGGSWKVVADWQTANTFTYSPPTVTPGNWRLGVWVRNGGPGAGYESYALTTVYTTQCPLAIVSSAQGGFVNGGTSASFGAATVSGCPIVNVLYQFWIRTPSGSWSILQPYSTTSWANWSTVDLPLGTYQYGLWAKIWNSSAAYDDYAIGTITLLQGACTGAAIDNGDLPSPEPQRTTVTFGATYDTTPPGGCGLIVLYRFWQYRPDTGTWKIVQDWSQSNTFAWDTTGLPAGPYRIGVWIKNLNVSPFGPAYTSYAITTFWVSG